MALAGQGGCGLSGQLPDSVVEIQTQGEQPAEVQPGEAVVEPGVVLDHARGSGARRFPRVSQAMLRSTSGRFDR